MVIPLSNEQREVRTPNVAQVRAVDASPLIQAQGQQAQNTISALGNIGQLALKRKQEYDDSRDAFKRNQLELDYNERTSQLNEELATKQGEERIKFQPKYEAEMKLAQDKYEAGINKIGNFQIREGSKQSINAWNIRNASNYQYENYKNETNLQQQKMGQALVSDSERLVKAITAADNAKSVAALANDPAMGFAHGEQLIRDFYKTRMGYPDEVVDQYIKDYKSKASIAMANRMAEITDELSGTQAYNEALNFLNSGIDAGTIDAEEGIKAKRALEMQKIDMVAELNPGSLINRDGTYNFKAARRYAPDLTQRELYQKISVSSKGNGSGSGAGFIQEQISQMAEDNWNDMVYKAGWGAELATDDYKERRADMIAGKRKASGKAVVDLLGFYNYGKTLLNGAVIINEDGTYTDPATGATTQTMGTGVKRVLQKQNFNTINKAVKDVEARIANMIETKSYADIFTPEVFKAAPTLDDGTRAVLANLQLLYQKKGGRNDGWLTTKIKNVLEATHLKHYDATGGVGVTEAMSMIDGTQAGIAEATRKYGFDKSYVGPDQLQKQVNLKQFNSKTGLYEDIPGMSPVTMETALNMEIGYATLRQMDDGMFQSIYGNTQKPETVADMQFYGYSLDWNGSGAAPKRVSGGLNKIANTARDAAVGIFAVPGGSIFPGTSALMGPSITAAFGAEEAKPFSFTDAQAYNVMAKAGAAFKKALSNTAYTGTAMPDKQFQDMQFTNKVFSGKPNNEALTYDEYVSQEGAATPDTYADYLSDRGKYLRVMGTIQSTGALDKNKPGKYFMATSKEATTLLSDMYAKAAGLAPDNPKYISEDVELKDVLSAGVMSMSVPNRPFVEPTFNKEIPSDAGKNGEPLFFFDRNSSTGYVVQGDRIKMVDCNAEEFVTLLGMAQGLVQEQPNVETKTRSTIPSNMISNQFKPR